MKKLTICLIGLIAMAGVSTAKEYTLQECIELAKKTDRSVIAARNVARIRNDGVWVGAGQFLPSVSVSGSYRKNDQGRTSPQVYSITGGVVVESPGEPARTIKSYSTGVYVGYTLFDGLQNVWDYLKSRSQKHSADYNYTAAISDLVYAVKGQYYVVLKARRDLDVARDAVKRSEELLKLFEEKYALGSASLSEVLKQKVQYGTDQLTLVTADKTLKSAVDNLAVLVGTQPGSDFDIVDMEVQKEEIGDIDTYIQRALAGHPGVLSARESISSSRYGVRSAFGQYLPTLSWSFSYGWSKDSWDQIKKFGPEDHSGTISLSLQYNVFDRFSRKAAVGGAKAGLSDARATELQTRNQVVRDVRDAHQGIKLAEETMKVSTETEAAAKEDMDLVQAKYNLGAAALWELLDAEVSLKTAQFNRVKAEFDYNLALAKLHNAMGEQ
ncbi:MAG: TolC family protein [candidate division Zixibacteria bacterium]|nr:TolC family protein [candidate division Zixibacteria bacterium]